MAQARHELEALNRRVRRCDVKPHSTNMQRVDTARGLIWRTATETERVRAFRLGGTGPSTGMTISPLGDVLLQPAESITGRFGVGMPEFVQKGYRLAVVIARGRDGTHGLVRFGEVKVHLGQLMGVSQFGV